MHFSIIFAFSLLTTYHREVKTYVLHALVVKWISRDASDVVFWVRILAGAHARKKPITIGFLRACATGKI